MKSLIQCYYICVCFQGVFNFTFMFFFGAIIQMLIAVAAVVTLLDSPVQTPTQASKWQNKNKASAFLFFLFSSRYVSEFLKLLVPHLSNW